MIADKEYDDNNNYEFVYSTDDRDNNKRMSRDTIEVMSTLRGEPYWMTEFRLRSYDAFKNRPTPNWGCDLSKIDFRDIYCHARLFAIQNVSSRACNAFKSSIELSDAM
jgi:Fe-S cluster assembly protein SufB